MKLLIDTQYLKAITPIAPAKDVRYYLNGVHVKRITQRLVRLAATDGHILMIIDVPYDGDMNIGDSLIIPIDTLKAATKGKKPEVLTLASIAEDTYSLGDQLFKPVDGRFPDVQRVVPDRSTITKENTYGTQFDPDLLAKVYKAFKVAGYAIPRLSFSSTSVSNAGVIHSTDSRIVGVVMPLRIDDHEYYGIAKPETAADAAA